GGRAAGPVRPSWGRGVRGSSPGRAGPPAIIGRSYSLAGPDASLAAPASVRRRCPAPEGRGRLASPGDFGIMATVCETPPGVAAGESHGELPADPPGSGRRA